MAGAVVFVGDSLIGNWKQTGLEQSFAHLKVANRGIGGDVSRGVLFRLREDALDLKPRAIVLGIGTNDLRVRADPAAVARNLERILGEIRGPTPLSRLSFAKSPRNSPKVPISPSLVADLNARIAIHPGPLPLSP